MAIIGYLVRVISNVDKDGDCVDKIVKLIPISDNTLEFTIPYEGDEVVGILKSELKL